LFEVKIETKTIEQRAFRQNNKNTTNVVKQSGNAEKLRSDKIWDSGVKGGKLLPHLFPFK
jgi:hypothetical protein